MMQSRANWTRPASGILLVAILHDFWTACPKRYKAARLMIFPGAGKACLSEGSGGSSAFRKTCIFQLFLAGGSVEGVVPPLHGAFENRAGFDGDYPVQDVALNAGR